MNLNEEHKILLEQWLEDPSFLNWANQNDEKDIEKWESYLSLHFHHQELAKIGKGLVLGISFKKIPKENSNAQEAMAALMKRLEQKSFHESQKQETKVLRLGRVFTLVASISILMLVSGITYFQFFHNPEVLLSTGFGEQLESILPDGSKVTLNANSSIKYFAQNPRKVWLTGEAYFEIKKIIETNDHFQVFTTDLEVVVLGTSFNVNARNDQTKIFLEEGEVDLKLNTLQKEIIKMVPGDLIAYSKKLNKMKEQRKNVSIHENAAWKEGTLIFNQTLLSEALDEIEDIYGIQFVFESKELKEELISGGVPIRDLAVTFQTLSELYELKIKADGERYFISGMKD